MTNKWILGICLTAMIRLSTAATSWPDWVAQLRQDAVAQGIRPRVFDRAFQGVVPSKKVKHLDRTQPEKRLTFLKYRTTRADNYRIHLGRKLYKRHQSLIDQISSEYGVNSCYIVSFWGLETSYGRYMGSFPVIQSLATLAYDGRRSAFFRKELLYALKILNEGHVPLSRLKGEWAGASGQPQFLPSSWYHYAVDYDKDGRRDIWRTQADVFASIANYLVTHGWQSGQPWGVQVRLPQFFNRDKWVNAKLYQRVKQWRRLGVDFQSSHWINPNWQARLIHPHGGPDLLVFNNFDVIMRWNRSTYYAGTVGYMADKICQSKTKLAMRH